MSQHIVYVFKCDPEGDQFTLDELHLELQDRLSDYTMDDFRIFAIDGQVVQS